jgi:hypothetical protein
MIMSMSDFFNQPLTVGDRVALTPKGYKTIVEGTIIGFTEKMVRIKYYLPHLPESSYEILKVPFNVVKAP